MKTQTKVQKKGKDKQMATAPVLVMQPKVTDYGKEFVNRTLLLKVSFGLPGFTKTVPKGNGVVKVTSGDDALYKTRKTLLESPELEAIPTLDNSFRMWLYANFTQFSIGVFVVPKGMVPVVEQKWAEFIAERKNLVKEFIKSYPTRCKEMKSRLGKGYDPNEYPPVKIVLAKFVCVHNYVSFEAPGKIEGINPDIMERQQKEAEKLFRNLATDYQTALRVNFAEMVKKMQDKLTDEVDTATGKVKQKRIHETAVASLQEFVKNFDLQNVAKDSELKAEVEKVRKLITGVDVEALRSTDTVRDTVRKGMEQVTAKLETMVSDAPIRKFNFAPEE